MRGVYPYWAGRDLRQMLDRGEDPLKTVCDVGHELGLKVFSSYRRMTCRMPPFTFPIHPDAMFIRRKYLWCAGPNGEPVPHLSLAYPEVRQRMIALLVEQAENYAIDGVHLFFARGMPFVFFEPPFLDEFKRRYGASPRGLALDDPRVWDTRAFFFVGFLRELRAALDAAGARRARRLEIALHVANSPRGCAYYGMDIPAIARDGLVDILIPARCHFLPDAMAPRELTMEFLTEFVAIARKSGMRIVSSLDSRYCPEGRTLGQLARSHYEAGVDGIMMEPLAGIQSEDFVIRRLGHRDQLDTLNAESAGATRMVRVHSIAGMPFDMETGTPTCG
jgi:hypothetical protein